MTMRMLASFSRSERRDESESMMPALMSWLIARSPVTATLTLPGTARLDRCSSIAAILGSGPSGAGPVERKVTCITSALPSGLG